MGGSSARLLAVVVDRRPLERNLVRFLLEENEVSVAAEAGTPLDAVREVKRQAPNVVVLNANAAWDAGRPLIPSIRAAAPGAAVILITPPTGTIEVDLLRHADAVLEEGVGLKDLAPAISRLVSPTAALAMAAGDGHAVFAPDAGITDPAGDQRWTRWAERLRGASIAAVLLVGFMFFRSVLPGMDAATAVAEANGKIDELFAAMDDRDDAEARETATELLFLWNEAKDAGAEPQQLAAISAQLDDPVVDTLLSRVPETSALISGILQAIVSDEEAVAPAPSPAGPTASPSVSPSPSPASTAGPGDAPGQGGSQGPPITPPGQATTVPVQPPTTQPPTTQPPTTQPPTTQPPTTQPPTTATPSEPSPSPSEPSPSPSEPSPSPTEPSPTDTSPTETTSSPPPSEIPPRDPPPPPPPPDPAPTEVAAAFALLVPGLLWLRVRATRRQR